MHAKCLLLLTAICTIGAVRAIPVPWFLFPHHDQDDFGAHYLHSDVLNDDDIDREVARDAHDGYRHAEWEDDYAPTENDVLHNRFDLPHGNNYEEHTGPMLFTNEADHPVHSTHDPKSIYRSSHASHGFDSNAEFWDDLHEHHQHRHAHAAETGHVQASAPPVPHDHVDDHHKESLDQTHTLQPSVVGHPEHVHVGKVVHNGAKSKTDQENVALASALIGSAPNPFLVQALLDAQARASGGGTVTH